MAQFMSEYGQSTNTNVEFIWVDEMIGSADGLRAASDRIRGDFICLGSDVLCQFALSELSQLHRARGSDITMLLASASVEESEKKGAPLKIRVEEEDQEYIGLDEGGRVVMKRPALEVDDGVSISKPILNRCSTSLTVRIDLQDMGIYIMAHWIMGFLAMNKSISNIRTELVPFLVDRQFQSSEYMEENMLHVGVRERPLGAVDEWALEREGRLLSEGAGTSGKFVGSGESKDECGAMEGDGLYFPHMELVDYACQEIARAASAVPDPSSAPSSASLSTLAGHASATSSTRGSRSSSSFGGVADRQPDPESAPVDLLRCFALVYERKGAMGAHGTQRLYRELDHLHLLQRVTTISAYLTLNRDVPSHTHTDATPWPPLSGYHKKEQSVVGAGCEMGDKVTIKQCSIGKGCHIGAKSRLNNCVLMENVHIGEGCTIQNTIVSANCVIENNASLNDCIIGSGSKVVAMSKMKGESISINSN